LRAAYIHVLADAITSVLAIFALLSRKYLGLWWMDPLMGIVGACVIVNWALGLLHRSGNVLLDIGDDKELETEVRTAIASDGNSKISDLHLWQVGAGHWAAIVSLVTSTPREPEYYKALLAPVCPLPRCANNPIPRSLPWLDLRRKGPALV